MSSANKGLSIVKKVSHLAGDTRVSVNRYGFKREYAHYAEAATALGCDHQQLYDKLASNREVVFVIHRKERFVYL